MTQPKLCKDCKHLLLEEWQESVFKKYQCIRPNLVNGERGFLNGLVPSCQDQRSHFDGDYCGPEAKYWEEKDHD